MLLPMALVWLTAALMLVLNGSASAPQSTPQSTPQSAPRGSAGCVGVPRSLPGQGVADAIAEVANLSTVASGISSAGLAAELNGLPQVTVFAPANEAFRRLPDHAQVDGSILRYHAVPKRLGPDRIVGTHPTLHGAQLSIARGDGHVRVNATAALICTRVEAANGNVYLIDALLTPPR